MPWSGVTPDGSTLWVAYYDRSYGACWRLPCGSRWMRKTAQRRVGGYSRLNETIEKTIYFSGCRRTRELTGLAAMSRRGGGRASVLPPPNSRSFGRLTLIWGRDEFFARILRGPRYRASQ